MKSARHHQFGNGSRYFSASLSDYGGREARVENAPHQSAFGNPPLATTSFSPTVPGPKHYHYCNRYHCQHSLEKKKGKKERKREREDTSHEAGACAKTTKLTQSSPYWSGRQQSEIPTIGPDTNEPKVNKKEERGKKNVHASIARGHSIDIHPSVGNKSPAHRSPLFQSSSFPPLFLLLRLLGALGHGRSGWSIIITATWWRN
jgi:hypothetical protein